jgi:hypothetical protein
MEIKRKFFDNKSTVLRHLSSSPSFVTHIFPSNEPESIASENSASTSSKDIAESSNEFTEVVPLDLDSPSKDMSIDKATKIPVKHYLIREFDLR